MTSVVNAAGFDIASFILENMMLFVPLFLLQIGLLLFALFDVAKKERMTRGPKWMWLIIILVVNLIGPLVYFLFGREEA